MKKPPMLSWADRFALIDAYNPSPASICAAFNLTPTELSTACALRDAGTFRPNQKLDITKYQGIFPIVEESPITAIPVSVSPKPKKATTTTHIQPPETASKQTHVKVPQKRGRKGNKITNALFAVTTTPVPVDQFVKEHGVSVAVLRQAKRFIEKLPPEDVHKIGKVIVKQDKDTKTLMIWREDI